MTLGAGGPAKFTRYGSPSLPTNFDAAIKPGSANSARDDLGFFMALAILKNETIFTLHRICESLNISTISMYYA